MSLLSNVLVGIDQLAKRLYVKSGGEIDIEVGGAVKYGSVARNVVYTVQGQATTAEIKVGKTILADLTGATVTVVDVYMQAIGGNAGGATSVDIKDTAEVALVAFPVAQLTQNTVNCMGDAAVTSVHAVTATAGKGLIIQDTAKNSLTTCTHVNYVVKYTIAAS